MNEKIFKTLGQIGCFRNCCWNYHSNCRSQRWRGFYYQWSTCPEIKRENNDLKMVGTGLHTGSLKCIIGNIKAKRMETRITRVFFKYALREKGWERNE